MHNANMEDIFKFVDITSNVSQHDQSIYVYSVLFLGQEINKVF